MGSNEIKNQQLGKYHNLVKILPMRGPIKTKTTFDTIHVVCASCIYSHVIFKVYVLKLDTCNVLYL